MALIVLAVLSLALLSACSGGEKADTTPAAEQPAQTQEPSATEPAPTTPPATQEVTKLKIEDVKKGTGAEAVAGKNVTAHYTLWLTDGTKLESSKDSGQPFTFQLGAGQVIPGWDQGVPGMKVGGVRKLTVPSDLAYGPQGSGPVPPNATLVFEIELVDVQ